jgi:5-methylcytosine-specific restriction endonuclease McrA
MNSSRQCIVEGCLESKHGHGLCRKHYREVDRDAQAERTKKWREQNKTKLKKEKAEYAAKNAERLREKSKRWYYANKDKVRARDTTPNAKFKTLRNTAKRRQISFDLDFQFYSALAGLPCFYCLGPLPVFGHGVDRKDNSKGYTKENVVPCCQQCNALKRDVLTVQETKAAIQAIYEVRKKLVGELWKKE